jgi:hypothetical protein
LFSAGYSRYIIAWKLCTTMKAKDVTNTLELALEASGCNSATVVQKPRLLSDNGSSYVAADFADYLENKGMDHVRGAPHHPQTQGKIERWHQTMKNRVLLENYFLPGDLERQIGTFVDHYNNHRYHESLNNLTPAARCECPSSTNATTRSRNAIGCGLPISNLHICHADRESRIRPQGNPESERSQRALEGWVSSELRG